MHHGASPLYPRSHLDPTGPTGSPLDPTDSTGSNWTLKFPLDSVDTDCTIRAQWVSCGLTGVGMDDKEQIEALEAALRAAGFKVNMSACGCCGGIYAKGTLPDGTEIDVFEADVDTTEE